MIDIGELGRWTLMKGPVVLNTDKRRKIRFEVNGIGGALGAAQLNVTCMKTGEEKLLATFDGRDTICFEVEGAVQITNPYESECDIYWYCREAEQTHSVVPDAKPFTRLATRKERNPELERMMHAMMLNVNNRLERQEREHEKQIADLKRQPEPKPESSASSDDSGTSDAGSTEPVSAQDRGEGASEPSDRKAPEPKRKQGDKGGGS